MVRQGKRSSRTRRRLRTRRAAPKEHVRRPEPHTEPHERRSQGDRRLPEAPLATAAQTALSLEERAEGVHRSRQDGEGHVLAPPPTVSETEGEVRHEHHAPSHADRERLDEIDTSEEEGHRHHHHHEPPADEDER